MAASDFVSGAAKFCDMSGAVRQQDDFLDIFRDIDIILASLGTLS
jgi:hypothetical protein